MSRKDTIIIALLINAGLLALLFMLAVNTDDDKVSDHSEISHTIAENQPPQTANSTPISVAAALPADNDEVDSFLKELSSDELTQPIVIDEEGYVEVAKASPSNPKPVETQEAKLASDGQFVEVTIKRGDALEKIARSNGTTVEAIKKANNMTSNKLTVGKVLRIPIAKATTTTNSVPAKPAAAVAVADNSTTTIKAPEKKAPPVAEQEFYTIKSGDNPWKIAKQFNVKFEDLLKLNGLNEEKARNLKAGDKVRVK